MCTTHESTNEGAQRPITTCSLCNGRGYLLYPTFNEAFGPSYTTEPCPKCTPYVPPAPLPWKVLALWLGIFLTLIWICFGGVL